MRDPAGIQRRARTALTTALKFYALSIALIVLLFALALALAVLGSLIRVPWVLLMAAPFAVAGAAITRGIWPKPPAAHPLHVLLDEPAAPELFEQLRSIAREAGTEPPSRVMIVHGTIAAVREDRAARGRTTRTLQLGAGLLSHLTVSELRAVLGHELGHFVAGDTEIALRVYGIRQAMISVVEETFRSGGPRDVVYRLYRWMFERFERDAAAVAREQEILADELGAKIAGNATMIRALRRAVEAEIAFKSFTEELRTWAALGGAARNIYEGFRSYLRSPAWLSVSDSHTRKALAAPLSQYDKHPTFDERALMLSSAAQSCPPLDDRPAWTLLTPADHLEALLCEQITPSNLPRLEWSEFRRVLTARQLSLATRIQARAPKLDAAILVDVMADRGQWFDFVCAIEPQHTGDASPSRDETVRARFAALCAAYFGALLFERGWRFEGMPGSLPAMSRAGETLALGEMLDACTRDVARCESFVAALDDGGVQLIDRYQRAAEVDATPHLQRWSPIEVRPLGATYEVKLLLRHARWPRCCVVCKRAATRDSVHYLRKQKGDALFEMSYGLPACDEHNARAHDYLRLREYDARNDVATFDTKDAALAQLIERVNA